MRFSVNTIILALISSSVVMTDVLAVPVRDNAHATTNKLATSLRNKGTKNSKSSRSLSTRQDSPDFDELTMQFQFLQESVTGISSLLGAVNGVVGAMADELGLNGSNTGDDGQDGDSNGDSGDDGTADNGSSTVSRRDLLQHWYAMECALYGRYCPS